MIIPTILLLFGAIIFAVSPFLIAIFTALLMPVWIEWEFAGLLGMKVGLIDVIIIGGFLGILAFFTKYQRARFKPYRNTAILIILFILTCLFVFPLNYTGSDIVKFFWGLYKDIYITLIFFLVYLVIKNKKQIETVINLLILSSVIVSIMGLLQSFTRDPLQFIAVGTYKETLESVIEEFFSHGGGYRAFGTLHHPNIFGGFLIWPLSICIAIFLLHKDYKYRKYLPVAITIQAFAILLSYSRGAWLGLFSSMIVLILYSGIYKKGAYILIIFAIVFGIILFSLISPQFDFLPGDIRYRFFSMGDLKDPALVPRYERWSHFFNKSLERPLTGHGIVTSDTSLDELEYAPTPHNTFLLIAVKWGYIALGVIIAVIIKYAVLASGLYKSSDDAFFKALGLGVFSGLIGLIGVTGMFSAFWGEDQITVLFWFLLAITLSAACLQVKNKFKESPS